MDEEYQRPSWADSVEVVLLEQRDSQLFALYGTTPVGLDDSIEPVGLLLEELLDATVQLAPTESLDSLAFETIQTLAVPPLFRASPWLGGSRALTLVNGEAMVGDLKLRYSRITGLGVVNGLESGVLE